MSRPDGWHLYRKFTCAGCGFSFDAPVYCGNRFCSICSGPRSRRMVAKLKAIVSQVKPCFGYKVRFLTLTIPNQEVASDGYRILVSSFRKFRNRQWWRNRVKGGAYVVEITGSPGRWHVHLHAMLECRYLPARMLSKLWASVSPGRIVHIKNVPPDAASAYLCKYMAKSAVLPEYQYQLSEDLKGFRLFQPFGSWHALALLVKKINYECPDCGYYGFYWNQLDVAFEKCGIPPPRGSLTRKMRDQVLQKYGYPDNAYYDMWLKKDHPWKFNEKPKGSSC